MSDATSVAEERTGEALAEGGFDDMRPYYRRLLRRLKERDAAEFEEATRRYREELVPVVAAGDEDPVSAWTAYGAWLAERLIPGRVVRLDETGRAEPAEGSPVPGSVLLYLPDEKKVGAIPLLRPAEPSPAQAAALELLIR